VTGGINIRRILDLLAAMGSGTEASRKDLMGAVEPEEEGEERTLETLVAKTVQLVTSKLEDQSASYQGFIGLLVVYIAQARTNEVSKYFKEIVPALSRMNLGGFMKIPAVASRKDRALKDVGAILGLKDLSVPMFKYGVYDAEKKAVVPTPKPTIAEWVTDILNGADKVPWSLNVSQKGEEFGLEETGPVVREQKRWAGVPIELRTLAGGVPFYKWKPLAVHFFRYIQGLNDLSKDPPVFQSILGGMSEEERAKYKKDVEWYRKELTQG